MKKNILMSLAVCGLVTSLQAGGDIGGVVSFENPDANIVMPTEEYIPAPAPVIAPVIVPVPPKPKAVIKKPEPKDSKFYTVIKGISIMGDDHGCNCADSGYGAGIDLGYELGNGFATELGLTFAKNDLNNKNAEASYKTGALSLVYTYPLTDALGVFAKAGYMMEQEKINALSIDNSESGLAYGGGLEYSMGDNYALIGEYQTSTIDSLRGDAASLGLKYNF
ncbi:MAG: porin family protein [Sulfurovaceae bacterium]|nr:porin family protein [Sulfurovaceae bacterium]